jgi:hypothetical protein
MGVKRMTQRNACHLRCPIRELYPVLFEALEHLDPIKFGPESQIGRDWRLYQKKPKRILLNQKERNSLLETLDEWFFLFMYDPWVE